MSATHSGTTDTCTQVNSHTGTHVMPMAKTVLMCPQIKFAQIMLVSESEGRVGCGKNKTLLKPSQRWPAKVLRSPCSITRNPPDQRQHPGRNHPMCHHFSPSCSPVAGMKEEAPPPSPHRDKGWQAELRLQVWLCLPMQGKGRAAHWGTKASPRFPQSSEPGQVCRAPPHCAVEAKSQAGLQSVGTQGLGVMRSGGTLDPGSGGQEGARIGESLCNPDGLTLQPHPAHYPFICLGGIINGVITKALWL